MTGLFLEFFTFYFPTFNFFEPGPGDSMSFYTNLDIKTAQGFFRLPEYLNRQELF